MSKDLPGKTEEETKQRIAACVNACAGIPTRLLETGDAKWAVERMEGIRQGMEDSEAGRTITLEQLELELKGC